MCVCCVSVHLCLYIYGLPIRANVLWKAASMSTLNTSPILQQSYNTTNRLYRESSSPNRLYGCCNNQKTATLRPCRLHWISREFEELQVAPVWHIQLLLCMQTAICNFQTCVGMWPLVWQLKTKKGPKRGVTVLHQLHNDLIYKKESYSLFSCTYLVSYNLTSECKIWPLKPLSQYYTLT